MTARIDWRRPDVLVLDDVFDDVELGILSELVGSLKFEDQELGRGMVPGRARERAQAESVEVANILWWLWVPDIVSWLVRRRFGIRL